ncbi:hypothetical protein KIT04_017 [Vibrio phage KIT04]|nr:hypothetical protein KIT04_017 [Vibrio phage KIT04]
MWPKKYEVEAMLSEVGYSFPHVFHVMIETDYEQHYIARICSEKCEPFKVKKKIWEYDKLILEVEQRLLEISNER